MSTDVQHHEPPVEGDLHEDDHHGATDKQYVVIALILAAMTAIEVAVSYIDIGPLFLPVLLILMVVKFFTVVLYFMHLKFDAPIYRRLFYIGLGLALFVYIVALFTFHFFAS